MLLDIQDLIASFGRADDSQGYLPTTSFQCCGITTKKKQCKINITDRSTLASIDELNRKLLENSSTKHVRAVLEDLAPLFFCKRYHRGQAELLIREYDRAVPKSLRINEREAPRQSDLRPLPRVQIPSSSTRAPTTRGPALDDGEHGVPTFPVQPIRAPAITPRRTSQPTPQTSRSAPLRHDFEIHSPRKSVTQINKAMRDVIENALSHSQMPTGAVGYVYVFTFPECYRETAPPLKIGFSKDVEARMLAWERQCKYKPKLLHTAGVELYKRVEKIVHAQLGNERRRETGCHGCSKNHVEWFKANYSHVAGLIGLWTDWSRQEPYDSEGRLKGEWQARLDRLDLSKKDCWVTFVNGEDVNDDEYDYDG